MADSVITGRSRRSLVAVVVAISTLFVSVPSSETVAARNPAVDAVDAVTWTVDTVAKTITVEVHLAFFTNAKIPDGRADTVSARIAFIEAAIKAAWDGKKFKCYTVRVKLVVRQVESVDDVHDDEVPVKLDAEVYPIGGWMLFQVGTDDFIRRAYVWGQSDSSDHLSEDPSDALNPVTGQQAITSTWYMFAADKTYAHEFGHILGLHDSYVEDGGTKPGAVNDLMERGSTIDATTITRVIRRAGIDEKQLKCPMTWDLPDTRIATLFDSVTLSIHAWTCDYDPPSNAPGAKPQIIFIGDLTVSGSHKDPILGAASAGGVERFTTTYPVGEPVLRAVLSTGLVVSQGVGWTDGLVATRTAALIAVEATLQLTTTSQFTDEAKECP